MFICPTCGKEFSEEDKVVKHYLSCWKANNPYHKPKAAPRSPDIETREINDDIIAFFNSFSQGV